MPTNKNTKVLGASKEAEGRRYEAWRKDNTDRLNSGASNLLNKYDKFVAEHPKSKLAADLTPVAGSVLSLVDTASDINKRDYPAAAIDTLGLIPLAKFIPGRGFVKSAMRYGGKGWDAARGADVVMDASDAAKNENERLKNKKAKGGIIKKAKSGVIKKATSASKRGDGIANKGKTKGRLR